MTEYYLSRRFEFYKAGLKTIRLPGAMCGPVFMVAYDIARLCQSPFIPVLRHPDWAAKLSAFAPVLFDTPEFARLSPQTIRRYKAWLHEFVIGVGGRCIPTLRYAGAIRKFQARPTRAALRKLCYEFRQVLVRAASLKCNEGQAPVKERAKTIGVKAIKAAAVHHVDEDLKAGLALLREPVKQLAPEEARKRYLRDRMRSFVAEERRWAKYPRHMQFILRKAWKELWPSAENVIGAF